MTELPATFIAKTRQTNCTVWIGSTNNKGYGLISIGGKVMLAHRVAYEAEYGPIPDRMVIDHLCRVRNCVNPMHLEAVSVGENVRRGRSARTLQLGDSCINGHLLEQGDIYVKKNGCTECQHCRRAGQKQQPGGRKRPTVRRNAQRVADDLAATERAAS